MFEGVFGFTQVCKILPIESSGSPTYEERVYMRKDCNRYLAMLNDYYHIGIIFPGSMKSTFIQSVIQTFPLEIQHGLAYFKKPL
jgi:hypothetical protein